MIPIVYICIYKVTAGSVQARIAYPPLMRPSTITLHLPRSICVPARSPDSLRGFGVNSVDIHINTSAHGMKDMEWLPRNHSRGVLFTRALVCAMVVYARTMDAEIRFVSETELAALRLSTSRIDTRAKRSEE